MDSWLIWLILAALFIICEALTQSLWALCLATGALGAMAVALAGPGFTPQLSALAAVTLIAYLALMPLYRRWSLRRHPNAPDHRTGMDALLGRRATITHEVRPGELGRARIDGDNWQVRAPGIDSPIPRGTEVIVTGYDSIILDITPAS
ncbi:MAG: NfeD family protein [Pseudoflavonifractor sp.]|nr:NfeD family protein [Alloprevotella sp.]MCM1116518.1 NfeD family protein [Pseudoflavonifractor sp.]